MEDNDFEPKYRKYRWLLEIPGLPVFVMRHVHMPNGHRMHVDFHYVNDMEIGKCPIPVKCPSAANENERGFHEGKLKILDAHGDVIKTGELMFTVEDYIPAVDLDYADAEYVVGRVVLWVLNPIKWN